MTKRKKKAPPVTETTTTPAAGTPAPQPCCPLCAAPGIDGPCSVCLPVAPDDMTCEQLSALAARAVDTRRTSADPRANEQLYLYAVTRCGWLEAQAEAAVEVPADLPKAHAERREQYKRAAAARAAQWGAVVEVQYEKLPSWAKGPSA